MRGGIISYSAHPGAKPHCSSAAAEQPQSESAGADHDSESKPWRRAFDAARSLERTTAEMCAHAPSLAKIRFVL
eukprot:901276-Pleurochrysis_carterae.AAC.1